MKIGIIGCGAYAIALSSILEKKDFSIMMWTKLPEEYQELTNNHTNLKVINYKLNEKINFTLSLEELSNNTDLLILAIPAKFVKNTIKELKQFYKNQEILIATKGMIESDNILIHEFIETILNTNKISCISGPSFAIDIIDKKPIGLTIASKNLNSLTSIKNIFSNINYISLDETNDINSIELCGILKNILAIGAGILNGMNINTSTIAKYLKDSIKEIQILIEKLNGNKVSFLTYAGFGDFILTTTNTKSRNYTFGKLIGENNDYKTYKDKTTIEGLDNLNGIYKLLQSKNINSNIINVLYQIVYLEKDKSILLDYLINMN